MMNKTKSGLSAKLKATLVAPIAILIFFLFADFTLKGKEGGFSVPGQDLSGLWIKQTKNDYSKALFIQGSSFSFSEGIEIRDFHLKVEGDALVLSQREGSPGTHLQYQMDGQKVILWWNNKQSTTYVRSTAENTLDHYLAQSKQDIDLPYISQYRLMEKENSICRIGFGKNHGGANAVTFNGKAVSLQEVTGLIEIEREKVFFLDQKQFIVMFLVDKDIPMSQVDEVRQELRKNGSLHIAEGGYPNGEFELSPLIYHAVGLPRLLPPLNAKILEKKEMEKLGGKLHKINLSARNTTPRDLEVGLQEFIADHSDGKYVISLEYDGSIPYGQYVETVDLVWKTVYSFRNALAIERYSVPYDKLGDELQREIRKAYPMALSETLTVK
jgi:biopolymer transport protein ExbD